MSVISADADVIYDIDLCSTAGQDMGYARIWIYRTQLNILLLVTAPELLERK
jgi:hypothetical protein